MTVGCIRIIIFHYYHRQDPVLGSDFQRFKDRSVSIILDFMFTHKESTVIVIRPPTTSPTSIFIIR